MNTPKKVLFVTRDKKPGMIGVRIARVLQAQGAEIRVVAEGLSVAEYKSADFDNCIVAEGPLDIKAPWNINTWHVLRSVCPDVMVCGLSSPMGKEEEFVSAARATGLNVPVVLLDDNWGAVHRCRFAGDLILTIDALGERLVDEYSDYWEPDDWQYHTEIIGDLSATAAQETIPQATTDAFNAAKGDADYAFILASQKWPESDDIIEIALASCALSLKAGAKLVVIPRFHPGAKPEDRERWNQKIARFSEEFPDAVKVLGDQSINTDHLAILADSVFAATGSALRAAAYAGKFPTCVWTPRLGEKLKAESGMEHHPLTRPCLAGYYVHPSGTEDQSIRAPAIELYEATHITRRICQEIERINHIQDEDVFKSVPFDAVKAAEAILAIAK